MNAYSSPFHIYLFRFKNLLLLSAFFLILSSCVTQVKIEYLQDIDKSVKSFKETEYPDYKLKSNDELLLSISSLDDAAFNMFSNAIQQSAYSQLDPYGASLRSYTIDKEGYLLLPVIGNIYVKGKTLSQVSMVLRDSLDHVLNQPAVTVKLVNRYISVLGNVNNPGHYVYSQDKLTIFDAIGLGGDIDDYGDRNNVILVRNENGENIRINLDLTKSEILTSEYYYIKPNDIVYVKPLREEFWAMRPFPWAIVFSAITTGLLIYEVIRPQ
jgi:polysaccharide biosynthesis/export protein